MEIKKLIKKTWASSCVFFTIITAIYMLILQIVNVEKDAAAVEAPRVLLFFVASLFFAIANTVKSIEKLNSALRYVIHYVIFVFTFYACFLLPTQTRASFTITGVVVFTVCYVIVMATIAAFASKLRKNRETNAVYANQFNNKK